MAKTATNDCIETLVFSAGATALFLVLCVFHTDDNAIRLVARALLATFKSCGVFLAFLPLVVGARTFWKVLAAFHALAFVSLFLTYAIYAHGRVDFTKTLLATVIDFRDIAALSIIALAGFTLPMILASRLLSKKH